MATVSDKDSSGWGGKSLIIGAIGFGLAAALLSVIYLKSREAALLDRLKGPDDKEIAVVVAKRDLPRGAPVTQENFAVRRIPSRFVHADAVRPGDFSKYEGNAIDAQLAVGKTLLKSFMDSEFPRDFSDIIEKGRRAMTIQVDELNSIAGFIRPGNRVDLFVNVPLKNSAFDAKLVSSGLLDNIPAEYQAMLPKAVADVLKAGSGVPPDQVEELLDGAAPKDVILPVLQNVKVLATGRDAYRASLDALRYPQPRTERSFSTITIDVDPREASLLTAAEDKGDLLALLRNREDEGGAGFTSVTPIDLFANAFSMAEQETARRARVATVSGVNAAGNLVDADGNTVMSKAQLEAAGYTVNEKGEIVDANGNVVNPEDLVVTADGKVLNKQQLAAAGLTVDENGQITDANGNVVRADELVIAADGKVHTKAALAAAGLTVNENGEIVDASGKVVNPDEIITMADGTVMTADQLEKAGLSVDASGNLVDASGRVVDAEEVEKRMALAKSGLTLNEKGEVVDASGKVVDPDDLVTLADGTVMTKEQLKEAGLSVDANGNLVDSAGNVVDPNNIAVTADGRIVDKQKLAEAGLQLNASGQIVDAAGNVVDPASVAAISAAIDFIVGGSSTDGVAKTAKLRPTE